VSSKESGYGQATPNDSQGEMAAISFIIRQRMALMSTMKPVQVQAVKGGGVDGAGTVDVLPLTQQIDGNGFGTPHGTVYGIPWSRTQGGKNAVICDPQKGDIGFVVAADRDMSALKSQAPGAATTTGYLPATRRQFNLADGIYIGGFLNVAPDQYLHFRDDGIDLIDRFGNSIKTRTEGLTFTDKTGNVIATSASGITLTPKAGLPVKINGPLIVHGDLQLSGALLAETGSEYTNPIRTSGDVVAGTISLKNHTHTQPPDSHGDTEQPTNAPTA